MSVVTLKRGAVVGGKYEVEEFLGEGGMGYVVGARHSALDQRVAIKLLRKDRVNDSTMKRFGREARAAAKIRSDHIARVFDVGALDDGTPYIVMEYLEGEDLGRRISRHGAINAAQAACYMIEVCEALAGAHRYGIIHRDIKPTNLFLARKPGGLRILKVLDFGVSKAREDERDGITATNSTLGTPQYMSPEQIRSARKVDVRSDIWSLGVVLYELLTGVLPFNGETASGVIAAIIADTPQGVRELNPSVPEEMERIIARCLEREPAQRYQSVADLAEDLTQFAEDKSDLIPQIRNILSGGAPGGALDSLRPGPNPVRDSATVRDNGLDSDFSTPVASTEGGPATAGAWDTSEAIDEPLPAPHTRSSGSRAVSYTIAGFVALLLMAGGVTAFLSPTATGEEEPTAENVAIEESAPAAASPRPTERQPVESEFAPAPSVAAPTPSEKPTEEPPTVPTVASAQQAKIQSPAHKRAAPKPRRTTRKTAPKPKAVASKPAANTLDMELK